MWPDVWIKVAQVSQIDDVTAVLIKSAVFKTTLKSCQIFGLLLQEFF